VLARISGCERGICFWPHWKVRRQSAMAKPPEMNTYKKMGGGGTQVRINRNPADGHFVMRYTTIEAMVATEKLWR
jgi:hypothetical protein